MNKPFLCVTHGATPQPVPGDSCGSGDEAHPMILSAREVADWERFRAAGHDVWQPVGSSETPLILAVLKQQPHNALRRHLWSQAWADLSLDAAPTAQARSWAVSEVHRLIRVKGSVDVAHGIAMLRAIGARHCLRMQAWKALARNVSTLTWFDALRADADLCATIGSDAIADAYCERLLELLQAGVTRSGHGYVPPIGPMLDRLDACLAERPLASSRSLPGWICHVPAPSLKGSQLQRLVGLMHAYPEAWWGPDRAASERLLFDFLVKKAGTLQREARQDCMRSFLVVTDVAESGPWLRVARHIAHRLTSRRGKRRLELCDFSADGPHTLAVLSDEETQPFLSLLDVPSRQSFAVFKRAWHLERTLDSDMAGCFRRPRL